MQIEVFDKRSHQQFAFVQLTAATYLCDLQITVFAHKCKQTSHISQAKPLPYSPIGY